MRVSTIDDIVMEFLNKAETSRETDVGEVKQGIAYVNEFNLFEIYRKKILPGGRKEESWYVRADEFLPYLMELIKNGYTEFSLRGIHISEEAADKTRITLNPASIRGELAFRDGFTKFSINHESPENSLILTKTVNNKERNPAKKRMLNHFLNTEIGYN